MDNKIAHPRHHQPAYSNECTCFIVAIVVFLAFVLVAASSFGTCDCHASDHAHWHRHPYVTTHASSAFRNETTGRLIEALKSEFSLHGYAAHVKKRSGGEERLDEELAHEIVTLVMHRNVERLAASVLAMQKIIEGSNIN